MKIFKWIWLVVSLALIGVSTFLILSPPPKKKEKVTDNMPKVAPTKVNYVVYNGDTVNLTNVEKAEAKDLLDTYMAVMSPDNYWWMPQTEITELNKLGNEYRTTIANYRIYMNNSNVKATEKYETSVIDNKNVITKTVFNKAWSDVVGPDIPITDGSPCLNMKYCNTYYNFNKNSMNYTEDKTPKVDYNAIIKITNVNKVDNKYNIVVRALHVEQNEDKTYSIYTDSTKSKEIIKVKEVKQAAETIQMFYKKITNIYFDRGHKYTYTFTKTNNNFILSGYKFEKAI